MAAKLNFAKRSPPLNRQKVSLSNEKFGKLNFFISSSDFQDLKSERWSWMSAKLAHLNCHYLIIFSDFLLLLQNLFFAFFFGCSRFEIWELQLNVSLVGTFELSSFDNFFWLFCLLQNLFFTFFFGFSRFEIWELELNVSLVGTFEFASAASHSTVHLINVIAPVIVPTVDIRPTNSTHKVWQIIILTDNFELISPTIDVCLTNFSLVWQMICLQGHHQLSGKSNENKLFEPNQIAPSIYNMIEFC